MTTSDRTASDQQPACLFFDGILEGPVPADTAALRQRVAAINAIGLLRGDCDIDGGRFTLLAEEAVVDARLADDERKDRLVRAIEGLLDCLPEDGEVESTIRCVELGAERARETLFGVVGRELQVMSRERPLQDADRDRLQDLQDQANATASAGLPLRNLPLLGAAAVLLVLLLAWQAGIHHRLFGTPAADLAQAVTPFEDLVDLAITEEWGVIRVELRRGDRFPADVATVDALLAESDTVLRRAAINAAAEGDDIYLMVTDADDRALVTTRASLGPLLRDADKTVTVHVPRMIGGSGLALRLHPDAGD